MCTRAEKKLRKAERSSGWRNCTLEVDEPKGRFETLVASGASYHEIVKAAERGRFDLIVGLGIASAPVHKN